MMNEDQKSIVADALAEALHKAARRAMKRSHEPADHYRIAIEDDGSVLFFFTAIRQGEDATGWIPLDS